MFELSSDPYIRRLPIKMLVMKRAPAVISALVAMLAVVLAECPGHHAPSGYTYAGPMDLRGYGLTNYRYCYTSISNCAHRCDNKTQCAGFTFVSSGKVGGPDCCYLKAAGPMPLVPFRKGDVGGTYFKNSVLPTAVDALVADKDLSTLVTIVTKLGLVNLVSGSNLTIFAPTNEAFAAALQAAAAQGLDVNLTGTVSPAVASVLTSILSLHIVQGAYNTAELTNGEMLMSLGGELTVMTKHNAVSVEVAAMPSSKAKLQGNEVLAAHSVVIHKINAVLMPAAASPPATALPTAVDALVANPDLTTLVTIVTKLGLVNLVNSSNLTIFAPTNEAFAAALQAAAAQGLDVNLTGTISPAVASVLTSILSLHIVQGHAYTTAELTNGEMLMSLGGELTVMTMMGGMPEIMVAAMPSSTATFNGSEIMAANNVVIHVINEVLMPAAASPPATALPTAVDALVANPDLTTLVTIVTKLGLVNLVNSSNLTIFAPTNEAFAAALQAAAAQGLDVNLTGTISPAVASVLTSILSLHIVQGHAYTTAELTNGEMLMSLGGELTVMTMMGGMPEIMVAAMPSSVATLNGSEIMAANNVVIHVINEVLMPAAASPPMELPTAVAALVADPDLTTLVTIVTKLGLINLVNSSNLTIFAPTNEAFAAALQAAAAQGLDVNLTGTISPAVASVLTSILSLHIVQGHAYTTAELTNGEMLMSLGGNLTVMTMMGGMPEIMVAAMPSSVATLNGSEIMAANNVVIHVINEVLMPAAASPPATALPTAVDALVANPDLTTLVTIVTKLNLVNVVNGSNLTIFAPTNEAFASLLQTASSLGLSVNLSEPFAPDVASAVTSILSLHIVHGAYTTAELTNGETLMSLGGNLTVMTMMDGTPEIMVAAMPSSTATLNGTEIMAANNVVIHVINQVLYNLPGL